LAANAKEILAASGKTGMGVYDILRAIIERVPAPLEILKHLCRLEFDSVFNSFRGIIAYFKVVNVRSVRVKK